MSIIYNVILNDSDNSSIPCWLDDDFEETSQKNNPPTTFIKKLVEVIRFMPYEEEFGMDRFAQRCNSFDLQKLKRQDSFESSSYMSSDNSNKNEDCLSAEAEMSSETNIYNQEQRKTPAPVSIKDAILSANSKDCLPSLPRKAAKFINRMSQQKFTERLKQRLKEEEELALKCKMLKSIKKINPDCSSQLKMQSLVRGAKCASLAQKVLLKMQKTKLESRVRCSLDSVDLKFYSLYNKKKSYVSTIEQTDSCIETQKHILKRAEEQSLDFKSYVIMTEIAIRKIQLIFSHSLESLI